MIGLGGKIGGETRALIIDAFPDSALKYGDGYAIVAIDVIRATTTAVTALTTGRRCFLAPTVDAAAEIARGLENPLMAGEIGGNTPFGFEMNNSPAEMATRSDVHRPAVLVTSSGTLLAHNASLTGKAFIACFRNLQATVRYLSDRFPRIVVIGAGSRAEFREEDQMCCALMAEAFAARGYAFAGDETESICRKWDGAPPDAWLVSNSVKFLRSTHQDQDLNFILEHRDDLDMAFAMCGAEAIPAEVAQIQASDIPTSELSGHPSPVGPGL